ncbi:MAG TPA: hypothetical protein VM366_15325 [Anaerolineae bacterium]|nr:hypothetical protein [Anaerolineae bacterium]
MDPDPAQAKPKVLVLCDDDLLQQIIALCLRDCVLTAAPLSVGRAPVRSAQGRSFAALEDRLRPARTVDGGPTPTADGERGAQSPARRDDGHEEHPHPSVLDGYDLIVLALGASRAEPLVALARASLLECVGVTPLLVISRRAFDADAEAGIYHMPFPFDAGDLSREVRRLAAGGSAT